MAAAGDIKSVAALPSCVALRRAPLLGARAVLLLSLLVLLPGPSTFAVVPHAVALPRSSPGPATVPYPASPAPSGPEASPVLGAYDPSALQVPVGGSRTIEGLSELWTGDGGTPVDANLSWTLSPDSLGSFDPQSAEFQAGYEPGNGTLTVEAALHDSTAWDQVTIAVYRPECILASLGPPLVTVLSGEDVNASVSLLDQTGSACAGAVQPSWSLRPAWFGTLQIAPGSASVQLDPTVSSGEAWLNASLTLNGSGQLLSERVQVLPSSSPVVLEVEPGSAEVPAGGQVELTATLENWAGLAPAGSFSWTVAPSSLGSFSGSGASSFFDAGDAPGSGWVNVTYQGEDGELWTRSVPVQVVPDPGPERMSGATATNLDPSPLLPGQEVPLYLRPTDAWGGLYTGPTTLSWNLTPAALGTLLPTSGGAVFLAGDHPGQGVATATLSSPGVSPWSVPFHLEVAAPAVTSVGVEGAPSDLVAEGGALELEGSDQDLFGNLLLAGPYYGLNIPGLNVSWSVSPADLGSVSLEGEGTAQALPEVAEFVAGERPGAGDVNETISWDGNVQLVVHPVLVVAPQPAAVLLEAPADTGGPFSGVSEGSIAHLEAQVLDGAGSPLPPAGNFSWTLALLSQAEVVGSSFGPSLELRTSSVPGVVLGNLTWTYANSTTTEEFLFDVVAALNASALALTPGGPSGTVLVSRSGSSETQVGWAVSVVPQGTYARVGTTSVPQQTGTATWSLEPADAGTLSDPSGAEENLTLLSPGGPFWLNATVPVEGGGALLASVAFFTYTPDLTYLQVLTGPCLGVCSRGLATFAGSTAYAAIEPMDQLGAPIGAGVSASVLPSSLGEVSWSPWPFAADASLAEVATNPSAGDGTLSMEWGAGEGAVGLSIPIETFVPPAPAPPTEVEGLNATGAVLSVDLRWDPPSSTGASRLLNYSVEWTPANALGVSNLSVAAPVSGGPVAMNVTGLEPGRPYAFRVRAWNGDGLPGPWTPWTRAVPLPPTGPVDYSPSGGSIGALVLLSALALVVALVIGQLSVPPEDRTTLRPGPENERRPRGADDLHDDHEPGRS